MTSAFERALNSFELAAQADKPADHQYTDKRRAVLEYVTRLEDRVQKLADLALDATMLKPTVVSVSNGFPPGEGLNHAGPKFL